MDIFAEESWKNISIFIIMIFIKLVKNFLKKMMNNMNKKILLKINQKVYKEIIKMRLKVKLKRMKLVVKNKKSLKMLNQSQKRNYVLMKMFVQIALDCNKLLYNKRTQKRKWSKIKNKKSWIWKCYNLFHDLDLQVVVS